MTGANSSALLSCFVWCFVDRGIDAPFFVDFEMENSEIMDLGCLLLVSDCLEVG